MDEALILAQLHTKLTEKGFDDSGNGVWWETPDGAICVLLTEKHTDVFFFAGKSYRLQYDSKALLLEDFEQLMGDAEEVADRD